MTTNTQPQTRQSIGVTPEEISLVKDILSLPVRPDSSGLKQMDAWAIAQLIQGREREARIDELEKAKEHFNDAVSDLYFKVRLQQLQPQAGEGGEG